MHNEFYASGFLYHPPSQQILLQQTSLDADSPEWSLFSGKNTASTPPQQAFFRLISEDLGIPIKEKKCFTVYDYVHRETKLPHFIHYAVVTKLFDDDEVQTENKTSWFQFRQIIKLPMQKQTRQDITVGQRVINLALRELLPTT